MSVQLTGPTVEPASGNAARQLVVFLHGVGADGNDLIDLAPFFAQALPDAAFVSPNAPFAFDMAAFGYQWFSLGDRSDVTRAAGVRSAAPILNAFIDAELSKRGLTDADLALVGFSQGTMMALHVGLRRSQPCAGIIGYSGLLVDPESLPAEITSRPRTLLLHGADDDVLPVEYLPAAVAALEAVGVPVQSLVRPGLGHGLDEHEIVLGIQFLAQSFMGR